MNHYEKERFCFLAHSDLDYMPIFVRRLMLAPVLAIRLWRKILVFNF